MPPRHGNPRGSSRVNLEATGLWKRNLGSWFAASSAWHDLRVLAGSVIFVLTYFLVLVLVAVFEIFFSFSFVLVFIIFSF